MNSDPSRRSLLVAAAGLALAVTGCTNGQRRGSNDGAAPGAPATLSPRGALPSAGRESGGASASPSATAPSTGTPSTASPSPRAGTRSGTLTSKVWSGAKVPWILATPAAPKALLVSLHGKGGNAQASVDLGITTQGVDADLAVLAVSGGNAYWHRRADGRDPGGAVLKELIPMALDAAGLADDAPIAFLGWSMGGYGSLLLASRLPADRVLAVTPMSTALWTSPATAPGAFDGASDYRANDVFAASRRLTGTPIRIVCGTSDPFIAANRAYVARRPKTEHVFDAGGHNGAYWSSHVPGQVRFIAAQL